jgi:hypothetical protein
VDQRYLSSQLADGGWGYHYKGPETIASMTCAGLIGLAAGHGSYKESLGPAWKLVKDKQLDQTLMVQRALAKISPKIGQAPVAWNQPVEQKDLYFLWCVERVGVLYKLKEIGGKDWYDWAAQMLVVNQQPNGCWTKGGYTGATNAADTCFALLILRRVNLVPDLAISLQELVPITDPPPGK